MASSVPVQEATERLSAMLEAVLKRLSKPEFDATAFRAQIVCKLTTLTNDLARDNPS
jgi:hypothetical protein